MFEMFIVLSILIAAMCFFLPKVAAKIITPKFVCGLVVALVFTNFAFAVDGSEVEWMKKISEILGNLPMYLTLLVGLLSAILAIALVIPGDQPDKFLQGLVDFLSKFSKKPKE